MKTIQGTIIGILFFGLFFSGCKKSDDDVNFKVTYIADLEVEIPPGRMNFSFSAESTIDPLSDENVEKYASTIKTYEIDSLFASITNISKNVNLVKGKISMSESATSAVWQFENLPLSTGATIPLGNENGQWDTVMEIFGRGKIVTVKIEGQTDEGDVNFTVQVKLDASVTAGAI